MDSDRNGHRDCDFTHEDVEKELLNKTLKELELSPLKLHQVIKTFPNVTNHMVRKSGQLLKDKDILAFSNDKKGKQLAVTTMALAKIAIATMSTVGLCQAKMIKSVSQRMYMSKQD
ncbi:unnamed protein product [Lepeophtheirus salmonis]|uniref:(salmon louse) hypothetical protein n=1 Tax=Lepeophtheirus salmonis TaxID=72036 RepID=A0A7R8CMI9_LEPSM|nr:unnamed protein product [Lepeophtheirus salmonis]CAF2866118.1 unnamed protein product [Lepeophtheirus salmonis]